jgi:hypothetical protein
VTKLSQAEHAELLSRLAALRKLAAELAEAFDDRRSQAGAREMLVSIDRMLAILGAELRGD